MAGIFSKGGGVPLTPAQMQLQQAALQGAQQFSRVWAPVQSFYANQVNANAPGMKEMGRGQAGATARASGFSNAQQQLGLDASHGRSAGSGAFLTDMASGNNATARGTGLSEAAASAMGDRHYVKGLQDVLAMYRGDQATAMRGLNTAAQAQAQEAGAVQQANAASQQGAGQALGTIAGLVAAFA